MARGALGLKQAHTLEGLGDELRAEETVLADLLIRRLLLLLLLKVGDPLSRVGGGPDRGQGGGALEEDIFDGEFVLISDNSPHEGLHVIQKEAVSLAVEGPVEHAKH